ncbi:hypothetical protein LXL04_023718 [Taraxacum kok-saghyz]
MYLPKKKKVDVVADEGKETFKLLKSRMSPNSMYLAVKNLSGEQRPVVRSMGFGAILDIQLDSLPGKLSYYIVDNFCPTTCCILTDAGEIKITHMAVHKLLGLPKSGMNFKSLEEVGRDDLLWMDTHIIEMKMVKENMKQMKQETPILLILTYGAISIMAQSLKQEAQLHKVTAKSKVGDGSAILKSKVGDRDAVEDDPYLRFKADDEGVNPGNKRVCSGPYFLPCVFLSKPGQPARLSRFGHFKGQIRPSVKDDGDRPHDTRSNVKILASNSKGSRRYESRKTAYEQRDHRYLRSRMEMVVVSKPELQTTNCWMFWNRHT